MDPQTLQPTLAEVLVVATRQHDLVTRAQLLAMGLGSDAIRHRLRNGRLHPIRRGVYAVGRPKLTRLGTLMAAVLSCGPDAALSHDSAAELWGIRARANGAIEVAVPASVARRGPGLVVHRRVLRVTDLTRHHGIPVTTPVCTLVDLATRLTRRHLEAAINGPTS